MKRLKAVTNELLGVRLPSRLLGKFPRVLSWHHNVAGVGFLSRTENVQRIKVRLRLLAGSMFEQLWFGGDTVP